MTNLESDDERIATITGDLRTVYGAVQQLAVPTWLKLDLTMAQLKALVAVENNPGISVCKVGGELSIGESAASLLIDSLVRRGDVDRTTDPDDRRRVRLTVTPPARNGSMSCAKAIARFWASGSASLATMSLMHWPGACALSLRRCAPASSNVGRCLRRRP